MNIHSRKKSFVILMLSFVRISYAQLYRSEIILNRGDTITGLGRITLSNKFKYRLNSDSKSEKIDFHDIDKVKVWYTDDNVATYEYVNVKEMNGYGFYVLRVVHTGKVDLYTFALNYGIYGEELEYGPFYVKRENSHYATLMRPKGGFNADYIKVTLPYLND
jgi:hypothetical protein